MAPWKKTMSTVLLLILGSISTNVHANIMKTPSSGLFLEGSDVTLSCVVQDNEYVIWEEDATSIFVGKEKNTRKEKYDNFEISSGDEDFSLIIKDVHLSDEGTYICKDQDQLANATVTIAVLPTLHILVKESEAMHVPHTSKHVNITCSAYNARPAVSVFELSVIGSEKTVNITNDAPNQNGDGKTFNSSATVPFIMSSNDISVHCRVYTAGQSLNHTEKFNLPRCNITISGNEVRCRCKANPPVDTYRMELNGNLQDGDVLYLVDSNSANITCFGTNVMGTGLSSILFHGNKAGFGILPIVVTISVAVVLMVLAVIYIRRRLSSRSVESDAEQLNEDKTREPFLQPGAHEENPPEDIKGNHAEHNMMDNSPMEVSDNHFSAAVSSNETSGSNKEISDGKDVDFKAASSLHSKPDSSSSTIEQACDIKDLQKYISKILLQVNKDWEIFAIEVLDISENVVEEAVMKNDNFKGQIAVIIEDITAKHIQLMDEITMNQHPKKQEILSEFNLECAKEEGRYYFRNPDRTQSYPSKSANIIDQTDPHSIESRDEMVTSCMDRIGRVGNRRLLAAFNNIETEVANILKMEQTKNLLSQLSKCHLFRLRKIVLAHSNTVLSNYIDILCQKISLDWEIFAVDILKLDKSDVIDIIERTKDENEQVLGMFQKWRAKQNEVVSIQDLESLLNDSKYANMILSENNSQKDDAAIKVKTTKEDSCSEEVLKMITNCNMRIGSVGCKRLGEAYTSFESSTIPVISSLLTSIKPGAIKEVSVDDSVESLWKLCRMLYRANLLTARNVAIHYVENELHNEISMVLKARASDWDNVAMHLFSLSKLDIVCIENAASSNEERLRMAISKWMRTTDKDEDVRTVLKEKAFKYREKTDGTSMLTMMRPENI